MRKIGLVAVVAILGIGTGLEAATYRLFVHGRSTKNHCETLTNVNSGKADKNNYWGGVVKGVANIRYVGFNPNASGGAYSWSSCGAQAQLHKAIQVFCSGGNNCEIYTHSTGGLVAAAYFAKYKPGTRITRIQLMANASGGSELANIAVMNKILAYSGNVISALIAVGFKAGGPIDQSVSTVGARLGFNHNNTNGYTFYTTSGVGSDVPLNVTKVFLPGKDDSVVANHSLCNVNKVSAVDVGCPLGTGKFKDVLIQTHTRWSNHKTIYSGGSSVSHRDAEKHYTKR